jgi:voltage-gated potassium channel
MDLDERGKRVVARLEVPMLIVSLLVIPGLIVDSAATSDHSLHAVALSLDWLIWLGFLTELVTMLWVVPDKKRYLRENPLDVLIVVATPPFLPVGGQVLRLLRLLRLIRIIQLAERVFSFEGLRYAAFLAGTTVVAGGFAFDAVERQQHLSTIDGLWWAVTTVTTVGYGDITPKTNTGRLIAVVVMFAGIGFVAFVTAAAAERFMTHGVNRRSKEGSGHEGEVLARLEALANALEETNKRLASLERGLGGQQAAVAPEKPAPD